MICRILGYLCVVGASSALVIKIWPGMTIVSFFILAVLVTLGATTVDSMFEEDKRR